MSEELGFLFGLAAILLLLAWIASELIFRLRTSGSLYGRLVKAERRAGKAVQEVESIIQEAIDDLKDKASKYEGAYLGRILRKRPIRDLKPYLSVRMSWSALEKAGITTLEQFVAFSGNYEMLHGIGPARGRGLRNAERKLTNELMSSTLPMPTIRTSGTREYRVIAAAIRLNDLHQEIQPSAESLAERFEQCRENRPSGWEARKQFFTFNGDALNRELERWLGNYEQLAAEAKTLAEQSEELGLSDADLETSKARYEENEADVRQMIDSATNLDVRGSVRPIGAEAMRAAEGFDNEDDFCDRGLEPLLEKMDFRFEREYTINRRIGSSDRTLYVDFVLLNNAGEKIAVLEAKRNIRNDRELQDARDQSLSYALFKQVEPVMVAAPQGLWLYERQGKNMHLRAQYDIEEAYRKAERLREKIESLLN